MAPGIIFVAADHSSPNVSTKMSSTLRIIGIFVLMLVCGAISAVVAVSFLMNLGLKLHNNYEYYGGDTGKAIVFAVGAVGFLSPALLIRYLRKHSYQVSLRMLFAATMVVAVLLGIYCLSW